MTATVNAKAVRAALFAARALGLDAAALAETRGLSSALTDVDARFPHDAWVGIWQDVAARTDSPSIGLDAAAQLPWGHFDVIDYLLGTADDLGTGLQRFERYFAIVSTGVAHVLEDHGDTMHLVRRYAPGCHTRILAPAEFAFACIVSRSRTAVGVAWRPREVRFAAPQPSSDAAHRKLFDCPIVFDAEHSAIVIDRELFALKASRPDPELARILERHAELLVGQLATAEPDLVGRVLRCIVSGMPDGDVTVARIARKLGMSTRTLQRRLLDSGESFDDLYDRTRHQLARRYLGDPGVSIQETAHLLAFGDLRGFYRAFRRWEGCTPAEHRRRLREGEAGAPGP